MEVLKTALQLEIDAENHYRSLAAQTEDVGLVNILNRLAEVEQRHVHVIQAMMDENLQADAGDDTFIEEVKDLCQKLEDSRSEINIDTAQIKLYEHAKARELEAEKLYYGAAETETDPETVALLKRLGAQETMHAQILDSIIDFLSKAEPGGWLEDAEWYHTDMY
ncbi:MAG: ferritin family protein [Kiritimatiellia bacterium]|jgi:rubrerythrin|nr:ferritin family protein [Kiritimatiellia bacterium]MDP6631223.1 ferritin family protein [Kiritimatiellia bacterium]MDP6809554.1 ferritin family protein [Kiritimatiellia bacterium]MDP7023595.1 ferritin family protein [Kiritimatiellia bacterium]